MTTRGSAVLLLATWGCGGPLVDQSSEGEPFFTISGPVGVDVAIGGVRTRGAIAWAWVADSVLGGVATEVVFEPRVSHYALEVGAPPIPDLDAGSAAPGPFDDLPATDVLFGLPVLYEPTGPDPVELTVDPAELVAWALGDRPDPHGIATIDDPSLGRVEGLAEGHLLLAMAQDDGAQRLSEAPSWAPGSELCALDELLAGLTLYRDAQPGCGRWHSMGAPGAFTEFQGVGMVRAE